MPNVRTLAKCQICQSSGCDLKFQLPHFDLCVCKKCGHLFSVIKSEKEQYQDDYFSDQHKEYFEKPDLGFFAKIHQLVQKSFPQTAGLTLLDVGTGFGTLPQYFSNLGYESYGIDISRDAVAYGTDQLKIARLTAVAIENYKPGKTFDVITCSNVIEHVPDPVAFLKEVNRLLSLNGVLVCDTVDSNSLIFFLAKTLYQCSGGFFYKPIQRVCDVHHLHHFNQKSLALAMEKSGFKIERCFYRNLLLGTISLTTLQRVTVAALYLFSRLVNSYFLQGVVCTKQDTPAR